MRVSVLLDMTGEARRLQITGRANGYGVLAAGTRIDTPEGTVVADGTAEYATTAAKTSASLEGKTSIHPPDDSMPQVVRLRDIGGEVELLEAPSDEVIDGVAFGPVEDGERAHAPGGDFVASALDSLVEYGGVAMDVGEPHFVACIANKIERLTLGRRIRLSGPLTATNAPFRDSAEGCLQREMNDPTLGSYVSHFKEQSTTW